MNRTLINRQYNADVFELEDGRKQQVVSGRWINFLDAVGEWRPIDCELKQTPGGWAVTNAPFTFEAPAYANGVARFEANCRYDIFQKEIIRDAPVSMTIVAPLAHAVEGELFDINGNGRMDAVLYENAFPEWNADLIYYVRHGRVPRLEKIVRFRSIPATKRDIEIPFMLTYDAPVTVKERLETKDLAPYRLERLREALLRGGIEFAKGNGFARKKGMIAVLDAEEAERRVWEGRGKLSTKRSIAHRPVGTVSRMRGIGLRDFHVWDDSGRREQITVEYEKLGEREYCLTKIVPRAFLKDAVYPVMTDASATVYPNANPESTSVDGYTSYVDADASGDTQWSSLRGAAGTAADDSSGTLECGWLTTTNGSQPARWKNLRRGLLVFDIDLNLAPVVTAVDLMVWPTAKQDDMAQALGVTAYSGTPTTSLASTDHALASHTTTRYASDVDLGSVTTGSYNTIPLNATGIAAIPTSPGLLRMALRVSGDIDNVEPSHGGTLPYQDKVTISSADNSGTTQDPKLVITYTNTPVAPSGLTATSANGSQDITLNWTDNSSNETNFRVERSPTGSGDWTEIAQVAAGVTTYVDDGIDAWSTQRYYRVRAYTNIDDTYSSYTSTVNAKTPPAPPTGVAVAAANGTDELTITWTDASSDEDTFSIERSDDGATGWTEIATDTASPYVDDLNAHDTRKYYRIRAKRNSDTRYSSYSSTVNAYSSPATPTTLACALSVGEAALTWEDNSSTETSFEIERKVDGAVYAVLTSPAANAEAYDDTTIVPGTTYKYRIRAKRSSDTIYSAYSNEITVNVPPEAPTNLTAACSVRAESNGSKVRLAWEVNSVTETGFLIERTIDDEGSPDEGAWSTVATTGEGVRTYEDTGRAHDTTYYYRVSAVGSAATSAPSSTAEVTTSRGRVSDLLLAFEKKTGNFPPS